MISLTNKIAEIRKCAAEAVKINCTYQLYNDIALFWTQGSNKAIISMLDGNMTIYNNGNGADIDELRQFIKAVSPLSVFSDADTMTRIFGQNIHRVCVMKSEHRYKSNIVSDRLSSDEIYKLLDTDGLNLPPYEHFAVDFCYRLNHGQLKYFALKQKCAAVTISDGKTLLLNGIASHLKGMGTVALNGVLSHSNLPCLAVCEANIKPFYEKNNFCHIYDAAYRRTTP